MPLMDGSTSPKFSFENDVSGRLFCWLIESGYVDLQAMIEQAARGEPQPDPPSWVKRFADALEARFGQDWAILPPLPPRRTAEDAAPRPKAPTYNIWFRPSPSKKIKFKEVARALLVFAGRIPPTDG